MNQVRYLGKICVVSCKYSKFISCVVLFFIIKLILLKVFRFVHRLRYLLRQLNRGEISAETLQKNLQYAAKVLEAVYIDETKYVRISQ